MKLAYLDEVLEKFALTGATYARALQNASARGGGRVGAPVLGAIANQPRAKLMPGLSQQARQSAELPTNVPGRNQALFDKLPRTLNTETAITGRGDPQQRARFDGALRRGGAVHQQPGTQKMIDDAFGPPKPAAAATTTRNIQPARSKHLGAAEAGVASGDRTGVMSAPAAAPSLGQQAATNVLQVNKGGPRFPRARGAFGLKNANEAEKKSLA